MTILFSQTLDDFGEAAKMALSEAGIEGVSSQTVELMATLADPGRLKPLAESALDKAVRHRWARARFSQSRRYYVVVPWLKYDAHALPALILENQAYVVASGRTILSTGATYRVVVIEALGKTESLLLPLNILYSLMNRSYHNHAVLERDGPWVTWNMIGFDKGVRLHSGLLDGISQALRRQSVNSWLRSFGAQGATIAPYVVGYLFGLMWQMNRHPSSQGKQIFSNEELLDGIQSLGYKETEARYMIKVALPELTAADTLAEAVQIVLRSHGQGKESGNAVNHD